ncbi:MAG: hypothetical protein AAF555_01295 [Verrucomicrobiota bacterium]
MDSPPRQTALVLPLLIAILLHLGLLAAMAFLASRGGGGEPGETASRSPAVDLLVTVEEEEEVLPEPSELRPPEAVIQPDDVEALEEAPETHLEADRNAVAASMDPALQGEEALPAVAGDRGPVPHLRDQEFSDGEGEVVEREQGGALALFEPQEQRVRNVPAPASSPEETPLALPEIETLENEPLASADSQEVEEPALRESEGLPEQEGEKPLREASAESSVTPVFQKVSPSSAESTFQNFQRKMEIRGQLAEFGRPALNTKDTPLGRYSKAVYDAIAREWHPRVRSRLDFGTSGFLAVTFTIQPDGRVTGLRKVKQTVNAIMTDITFEAILRAEVPPIPEEVLAWLEGEPMEVPSFRFHFLM